MIINHDEYVMKSMDKLDHTFLAGLPHNKWNKLHIQHDAAKGFESFVSCKFVVHQKTEATYTFRSQNNEQQ